MKKMNQVDLIDRAALAKLAVRTTKHEASARDVGGMTYFLILTGRCQPGTLICFGRETVN